MLKNRYILLGMCLLSTIADSRPYRARYKYSIDANRAEEVLAGISLNRRLYDDEWLDIVGRRKGDSYTIQRGDSLWRIAGTELGNSRLWRKLWEVNPFLGNPHELTIGQILSYYRESQKRDAPPLRVPLVKLVPSQNGVNDLDNDSFVNPDIKNRYHPSLVVITEDEVIGQLTGAFTERTAFDLHDEIYVDFFKGQPNVGERFTAVRFERMLKDRSKVSAPIIGTLVRQLGEIQVIANGAQLTKVILTGLYAPLRRGDRIIRPRKTVNWSAFYNPPENLDARIVAGEEPGHQFFSQGEIVLLNKGKDDGVKDGFLFRVFRDIDPAVLSRRAVEPDYKGEVQVIYTGAQSAVAYIIRNRDLIQAGDRVVPAQTFPNPPPPPMRSTQTIELD